MGHIDVEEPYFRDVVCAAGVAVTVLSVRNVDDEKIITRGFNGEVLPMFFTKRSAERPMRGIHVKLHEVTEQLGADFYGWYALGRLLGGDIWAGVERPPRLYTAQLFSTR